MNKFFSYKGRKGEMKFSVIYMGDINALNGASKVVKSFLENSQLFKKNGVTLNNIFCSRSNKKTKKWIKNIFSKTFIGSLISIYIQYFSNAKKAVKKYINSNNDDDVIVFHDIFSCYTFKKYHEENSIKIILVLHNNGHTWEMLYEYFPKIKGSIFDKFLDKVEKETLDFVDRVVFVSKKSASNFCQKNSSYSNKVEHIYNGIPSTTNTKNEILKINKLNMVSVGTLNSRKSQDLILKSLNELDDDSIKLTLIGDGDKFHEYHNLAKKFDLLTQVEFLGQRKDVEELLPNFNLFIMSSKDEGLPISIIEAMKFGLPIIATDVGGIKELINGNGILVEPNYKSIKSAISKINSNKNSLKKMSNKSLELFRNNFTVTEMIKNYSNLIKRVVNCEFN